MTFKERFAKELKNARKARGITQAVISEKLEIEEKSYAKYEQDKNETLPPLDRFADIVKILEIEPATLLFSKVYTDNEELVLLVNSCPDEQKQNLKVIIKAFLSGVGELKMEKDK